MGISHGISSRDHRWLYPWSCRRINCKEYDVGFFQSICVFSLLDLLLKQDLQYESNILDSVSHQITEWFNEVMWCNFHSQTICCPTLHSTKKETPHLFNLNLKKKWGGTFLANVVHFYYSNGPHCLPVLHLVILIFANEKARSFFFDECMVNMYDVVYLYFLFLIRAVELIFLGASQS